MFGMRKFVAVGISAALLVVGLPGIAAAAPDDPVAIPDPALRECVTGALGLPEDVEPTEGQLAELTDVSCFGAVGSLAGLEHASGLYSLWIDGSEAPNTVSDLSPLSALPRLQRLGIGNSPVTDLRPLVSIPTLQELTVDSSRVTDLEPLTGMDLRQLHVSRNQIRSLAPVAGMTHLTSLKVDGNPISDLSPISGLPTLWSVKVGSDELTDLTPAAAVPKLVGLEIVSSKNLTSLAAVRGMTQLDSLDVLDTPVSDLSPLSNLSKLRNLRLEGTKLASLRGIRALPRLTSVTVTDAPLVDASDLPLNSMGDVRIERTQLSNLTPFTKSRIYSLSLRQNKIKDIAPLASLQNTYTLDLSGNVIEDVSPLAKVVNVTGYNFYSLGLEDNRISDLSSLSYDAALSHAVRATGQTVDVTTPVAARTPIALPVRGRPQYPAIQLVDPPVGVTLSGDKISYPAAGSYTVHFAQQSVWDDEHGDFEYFNGTFHQTVVNAVPPQPFVSAPVPRIIGTARVGTRLTAAPGAWAPAPVALRYQWYRGAATIAGGTGSSYLLTPNDRGQRMSVRVTGSKAGYLTATRASAATVAVAAGVLSASTPTWSGAAKVGSTLTARVTAWGPAPVRLGYQWLRNGKPIVGATRTTYKLASADNTQRVSVRVTGTKTGYATAIRTSAAALVKK